MKKIEQLSERSHKHDSYEESRLRFNFAQEVARKIKEAGITADAAAEALTSMRERRDPLDEIKRLTKRLREQQKVMSEIFEIVDQLTPNQKKLVSKNSDEFLADVMDAVAGKIPSVERAKVGKLGPKYTFPEMRKAKFGDLAEGSPMTVEQKQIQYWAHMLDEATASQEDQIDELIDEIYYQATNELNTRFPTLDGGRANNSVAYALEKESVNDKIEDCIAHPNNRNLFTNLMDEVRMYSDEYLNSHGYV